MERFLYDRMYRPVSLQFSHLSREKWQGCVISTKEYFFQPLFVNEGSARRGVQCKYKNNIQYFLLNYMNYPLSFIKLNCWVIISNKRLPTPMTIVHDNQIHRGGSLLKMRYSSRVFW